jgi:multiple sugar transport system ATP-binding protein
VPARVIVVEPTGNETELLVQVGEAKLSLVVHGRVQAEPDDTIGLVIRPDSAHLFDRQSGRRLN